jgi:hypothetical protein
MPSTSSRRNFSSLSLLSGALLSLAALAPLASLGVSGCGGDDSGTGGGDSGSGDVFIPGADATPGKPDSSPGHDATAGDTGGPPVDWGNPKDGAADTGTPDGEGADSGGTDAGQPDAADAAASVPTDPIALWHFDEGSGSVAFDSSGNAHTATLFGGATFAQGKHGTGLSPNASGWAAIPASLPDAGVTDAEAPDADAAIDDASSPDADAGDATDAGDGSATFAPLVFDTTRSFSVVCWVKVYAKGPGQWQSAFSRDGTNLSVFTLKLRGDSPAPSAGEQFDFDFPGADDTSTGIYTVAQSATSPALSLPDGGADNWYHLAGVLDRDPTDAGAATVRIYVNGALEATAVPGTAPILEAVGETIIGASLFTTRGASWNGVIDEVSLYDRALSATEVNALYVTTK